MCDSCSGFKPDYFYLNFNIQCQKNVCQAPTQGLVLPPPPHPLLPVFAPSGPLFPRSCSAQAPFKGPLLFSICFPPCSGCRTCRVVATHQELHRTGPHPQPQPLLFFFSVKKPTYTFYVNLCVRAPFESARGASALRGQSSLPFFIDFSEKAALPGAGRARVHQSQADARCED